MISREVQLKQRPEGMPAENDFMLVEAEVAEPADNEVTVRNVSMSVDPYMRGRMVDRKSYTPPFQLGETLIERELHARGANVDFRATGQTGILISGRGVAVDGVIADFVSGAAEWLTPANDPDHWDVVEGQGSLLHPSYAGVSLALLHGTQPDVFVVCHEPTRTQMRGVSYPVPSPKQCIEATLVAGRLTNPAIRCVGIGLDTSRLDRLAASDVLERTADELGLACVDPMVTGVGPIVDFLLQF